MAWIMHKKWQCPQALSSLRIFLSFILIVLVQEGGLEVLTPPYFNLAENRRITATATCGEDEPELYCKLAGANADTADINSLHHIVDQGQSCDYCNKSKEGKFHPAEYAIDGSERRWQSAPLSRGLKYNEVNLTIDLGQEFHVAYVFITMGNSPRPGVWVLERSHDNGNTFQPWQYFAETPGDCERYFGVDSLRGIEKDDSVICDTQFSKVIPLEGGEIVVSLLNNRPSASDFFGSLVLQEWARATNIRFRLLRTKTLLGHLMSVAQQDNSVTRRYFYSIKDISIGGRCRCNGHADLCDITDPADQYKLLCRCQHNTCGAQCESCCPGYVQKAWRPATYTAPFVCEPMNTSTSTSQNISTAQHVINSPCEGNPKSDVEKLLMNFCNSTSSPNSTGGLKNNLTSQVARLEQCLEGQAVEKAQSIKLFQNLTQTVKSLKSEIKKLEQDQTERNNTNLTCNTEKVMETRATTITTTESRRDKIQGNSSPFPSSVAYGHFSGTRSPRSWIYNATTNGPCFTFDRAIFAVYIKGSSCVALYQVENCTREKFQMDTTNLSSAQDIEIPYKIAKSAKSIGSCSSF